MIIKTLVVHFACIRVICIYNRNFMSFRKRVPFFFFNAHASMSREQTGTGVRITTVISGRI